MSELTIGKVAPTHAGEWDSAKIYNIPVIVSHNGSSYFCKRMNCEGIEPGVTAGWTAWWGLCAQKGIDGHEGTDGSSAHIAIDNTPTADGKPSCVIKTWEGNDPSTGQTTPNLYAQTNAIMDALDEIMNGTIDVTR